MNHRLPVLSAESLAALDAVQRPDAEPRRVFLQYAAIAAGALLSGCTGVGETDAGFDGPSADASDDTAPDAPQMAGLPSLGGAPNTPQGRTIAAFVDTVVPGRWRDPENKPGGIDADVPAMFYDAALPALPLVPLLVSALDGVSREIFRGRTFERLMPDERDRVVEEALTRASQLDFAVQLVKIGFYGSEIAGRALGYPGANAGYVTDIDFSFNAALSREVTEPGGNPR